MVAYNEMVLARSEYPTEGFPLKFRIAYSPDSSELIVEYDLPEVQAIPKEAEYRYVKTKDAIESKARKPVEIKQLYQDIVASITLRILVCTSGYGPDAYNFSKDKPIELIDGGGLLYLLREHAGTAARIAV